MDLSHAALLLAAGLAAGTVNAVAGGGSLITFPAMIAIGLPRCRRTSATPSPSSRVPRQRGRQPAGPAAPRALATLVPTTIVGTILGALLLLATPARAFELVVPFLVLGATAVLAFQDPLRRLVGHPGTCRHASGRSRCRRWSRSGRCTAGTSAPRSA
ncbi:TSUP family transporter [Micromonospora sp. M12]